MSSSPIANISRKVYETAVTERSRKARVLKMVESMTLHEQCEEMSINTFTENVEFDHQFITDLDIIIIELLHWGGVAFRDLGFFNGMGDDGYRQVNGTLMPNGSNISQIKIGYLFDPEDDPVSYLLIYLASATLVIFTFACLTHFYCVVSQFSAKKRTDILRVQKLIASNLLIAPLMLSISIWMFYKSTNYANPAAVCSIIFAPLLGIAIGMRRFSKRFANYLLFLTFFRLFTIFSISQIYKFFCELYQFAVYLDDLSRL